VKIIGGSGCNKQAIEQSQMNYRIEQVAAVLTAKGRSVAAIYRITQDIFYTSQ